MASIFFFIIPIIIPIKGKGFINHGSGVQSPVDSRLHCAVLPGTATASYVSCSLNSLKGVGKGITLGFTIGAMEGILGVYYGSYI